MSDRCYAHRCRTCGICNPETAPRLATGGMVGTMHDPYGPPIIDPPEVVIDMSHLTRSLHRMREALRDPAAYWRAKYDEAARQVRDLVAAEQDVRQRLTDAEKKIAALEEAADESHVSGMKMADLLERIAVALKGEPKPLWSHSWHDLPDVAATLKAERDDWERTANRYAAKYEEEYAKGLDTEACAEKAPRTWIDIFTAWVEGPPNAALDFAGVVVPERLLDLLEWTYRRAPRITCARCGADVAKQGYLCCGRPKGKS